MALCPVEEQQRMLQKRSELCTFLALEGGQNYEHPSSRNGGS